MKASELVNILADIVVRFNQDFNVYFHDDIGLADYKNIDKVHLEPWKTGNVVILSNERKKEG